MEIRNVSRINGDYNRNPKIKSVDKSDYTTFLNALINQSFRKNDSDVEFDLTDFSNETLEKRSSQKIIVNFPKKNLIETPSDQKSAKKYGGLVIYIKKEELK